MNFVEMLKEKPLKFYLTLGSIGLIPLITKPIKNDVIRRGIGAIMVSLTSHYAFNYIKVETKQEEQEEPIQSRLSPKDDFFKDNSIIIM